MADFELTCLLYILSNYASKGFVLRTFKSIKNFCGFQDADLRLKNLKKKLKDLKSKVLRF